MSNKRANDGFEWPVAASCAMLLTLLLGIVYGTDFSWKGIQQFFQHPSAPVSNGSVLIAATNPDDRLAALLTVEPRGYTAILADTVKEGMARFLAQPAGIKIVIIEGTMPGSKEMASLLRRSLPDSHVIVLRDHRQPEVLPRLLLNLL
jgi:hypothetical protein